MRSNYVETIAGSPLSLSLSFPLYLCSASWLAGKSKVHAERNLLQNPWRLWIAVRNWMDNWNDPYQSCEPYGARSRQTRACLAVTMPRQPSFSIDGSRTFSGLLNQRLINRLNIDQGVRFSSLEWNWSSISEEENRNRENRKDNPVGRSFIALELTRVYRDFSDQMSIFRR